MLSVTFVTKISIQNQYAKNSEPYKRTIGKVSKKSHTKIFELLAYSQKFKTKGRMNFILVVKDNECFQYFFFSL